MVVISSVFTDKYADNIEKCIGEMTENIKPKSIGLNIFHILEKREIQNDKTRENYQKYIKAFELARDKGLYIEHIMRRIRPLIDRKVRIKDCGACGNRIVSDVSGNIGICEGLVGNEEYFFERDDLQSVKKDKTFLEWAKRTPLTMEMCIGCRASGICGGGCVNNALWQHGSVFAPDDYICESSKQFIDWALKQWYNLNNINDLITNENSIVFLNQNQRLKLIGKLKSEFDIPLQTMSKQYEVKGE